MPVGRRSSTTITTAGASERDRALSSPERPFRLSIGYDRREAAGDHVGISARSGSMEDIAALIDARAERVGRPKTYRKRVTA